MSMDQPSTSPNRARSRGLSFHSDRSGGSKPKVDTHESPAEKARRDSIWKNKSNPNSALSEETPGAAGNKEDQKPEARTDGNGDQVRNLNEASTLASLRGAQHKDANGNLIADPDLSNPTRPRLERPLDTIRSFEKAIDNGYKRKSSYMRSESYNQEGQSSRRNSYFGGGEYMKPSQRRRSGANVLSGYDSPGRQSAMSGGYYGGQRDSYMNGPPRMRYGNRMMSDSNMYNGQGRPYPHHGYQQSQDTMHTGVTNGSDSTGPWASGTDPSSENSSIDRNMAGGNGNGKQPAESYGYNGYNNGYSNGYSNGYGNGYASPPIAEEQGAGGHGGPVQAPPPARQPISLGNSAPGGSLPSAARAEPEKKKGWLKKRFSKG
ncbi:hypothetical protein D0867_03895 [Hortaea werneckii]|uniref:DUF2406 domain-containing protein n=1 Tax=Hortaea werneckii TaxID=91943 RepID=A0A3M6ZZ77_HORWE|nr:hypothetical protein D0867_03895 [Hortaea werneckii]